MLLSSNPRFAQFFIKPLMSPDAVHREIKAVDSGMCYFFSFLCQNHLLNSNFHFPVFSALRKSEKPFIRSLANESGTCIFKLTLNR